MAYPLAHVEKHESISLVRTWNRISRELGQVWMVGTFDEGLVTFPIKRMRSKKGILQVQRDYLWIDAPADCLFSGQERKEVKHI